MASIFSLALMVDRSFDPLTKRLMNGAHDVMHAFERESLDPIDIIVAACKDSFLQSLVYRELGGITLAQAMIAAQYAEDRRDFRGRGVLESYTTSMVEMLGSLYDAHEAHLWKASQSLENGYDPDWSWLKQLVAHAVASNSPAVKRLRP